MAARCGGEPINKTDPVALGAATTVTSESSASTNNAPTLTLVNDFDGVEDTCNEITFSEMQTNANEADADSGDTISFVLASLTSGALATDSNCLTAVNVGDTFSSGSWFWKGGTNVYGNDVAAFTIVATDGADVSASVQVSFDLTGTQDDPTLTSVSNFSGSEDACIEISYDDLAVNANEDDPDGGAIQFQYVATSTGTLYTDECTTAITANARIASGASSWYWKGDANDNGNDTNAFTVKVYNGITTSASAVQVNVDLAAENDAPTFTTITDFSGNEDACIEISYVNLASQSDEADVDGDALQFQYVATSTGTLYTDECTTAITANARIASGASSWYWKGDANDDGDDTNAFTVKVFDGTTTSASAIQVNVDLTAVNDAPAISCDALTVAADSVNNAGSVMASDIEQGSSITYSISTAATKGTATINAAYENYTYTPNASETGTDTFTVQVDDGQGANNTNTCEVIVSISDSLSPSNVVYHAAEDPPINMTYVNTIYGSTFLRDTAGNFYQTANFGTAGAINVSGNSYTTAGMVDVAFAKYSSAGVHQWSFRVGTNHNDIFAGTALTSDGNIIVLGHTSSTTAWTLTGCAGTSLSANTTSYQTSFVAKLNSATGACMWAIKFAGTNDIIRAAALAVDSDDNIYVTGHFNGGVVQFNSGITLTSAGAYDTFIVKLSSTDGSTQWARSFTSSSTKFTYGDVAVKEVDGAQVIYVSGSFFANISTTKFGEGAVVLTSGLSNVERVFVAKLDSSGDFVQNAGDEWLQIINVTKSGTPWMVPSMIEIDSDGNPIVSVGTDGATWSISNSIVEGTTRINGALQTAAGDVTMTNTSAATMDDGIFKLRASDAKVLWARQFGGSTAHSEDVGETSIDSDDNYYVSLRTYSATATSFGGPTYTNIGAAGTSDFIIIKYNSDGNYLWDSRTMGSSGTEAVVGIATTTSVGNVYLAGSGDTAIDFGSGNSTAKGTFIIELSQ